MSNPFSMGIRAAGESSTASPGLNNRLPDGPTSAQLAAIERAESGRPLRDGDLGLIQVVALHGNHADAIRARAARQNVADNRQDRQDRRDDDRDRDDDRAARRRRIENRMREEG